MVDYHGTNPLAEVYAGQMSRAKFEAMSSVTPPPKMFANGTADVPAFTRSGIDPQALLRLPYGLRHAAAENPDLNAVYQLFEDFSTVPEARIDSDGLRQAENRMAEWSRTTADPRPVEVIQAESDAEYEQMARSMSPDGLLPQEREERRRAQWEAKREAAAAESNERWGRVAAKRERDWQALQARGRG